MAELLNDAHTDPPHEEPADYSREHPGLGQRYSALTSAAQERIQGEISRIGNYNRGQVTESDMESLIAHEEDIQDRHYTDGLDEHPEEDHRHPRRHHSVWNDDGHDEQRGDEQRVGRMLQALDNDDLILPDDKYQLQGSIASHYLGYHPEAGMTLPRLPG